jgi:hypothetical protein
MLTTPDTPPNITSISFEVFRADSVRPEQKVFLYDPEENVTGLSLNDPDLDSNAFLQSLVKDPSVTSARTSISFDHSVRPLLPIPGQGKCPQLESIGALIGLMVGIMKDSGEFTDATPDDELMLHLAALTGRSLELPDAPAAPRL